jgi:glycosyltransferase involved in cell wall biosynthesis
MGKRNKNKNKNKTSDLPLVSVCTPTFNRRPFINNMIKCYENQTYPKSRMEWIIVDDGTDPIKDIIDNHTNLNIKYFQEKKMNLGEKRNYMHTKCKGSIIVYMDDDDYYPPERVEHAVEMLKSNKKALCAGSSEIYVYFKDLNKMLQCGPYGETHATAGTFAFRKELLDITSYEDHAALAEERHFLKGYTIPFVQLNPLKTILVFSHLHNTFDKKRMLKYQDNTGKGSVIESDKTVDKFIKFDYEEDIKKFFLNDIEELLNNYEPGLPIHKPDVLKQTEEIEKKRKDMENNAKNEYLNQETGIIIENNGVRKNLKRGEVLSILESSKKEIEVLKQNAMKVNIEFPNGELKCLNFFELSNACEEFSNKIKVQNKLLDNMRNQIKAFKKES